MDTTPDPDAEAEETVHSFLAEDPEGFTYDADGNLTQDGRWSYTWNGENRLIEMDSLAAAVTAGAPDYKLEFAYDAQGRRFKKKVYLEDAPQTTTYWFYDGWNPVYEVVYDGQAQVIRERAYVWGLDLSGSLQGAGGVGGLLMVEDVTHTRNYYPCYDGNGNVTGLMDPAFGEVLDGSNLEGRWRFNGNVLDETANDRDGTLNGDATYSSTRKEGDYSLSLDGDGDYVQVSGYKGVTGTDARTVMAWIKTSASRSQTIASWGAEAAGQRWELLVGSSGRLWAYTGDGYVSSESAVNGGQWRHVAVTWENDGTPDVLDTRFYVDGEEDSLRDQEAGTVSTGDAAGVRLGRSNWSSWDFEGLIEDAHIYSRALEPWEIARAAQRTPLAAEYEYGPFEAKKGGRVNFASSLASGEKYFAAAGKPLTWEGEGR